MKNEWNRRALDFGNRIFGEGKEPWSLPIDQSGYSPSVSKFQGHRPPTNQVKTRYKARMPATFRPFDENGSIKYEKLITKNIFFTFAIQRASGPNMVKLNKPQI